MYVGMNAKYRMIERQSPYIVWEYPSEEEFLKEKFGGLDAMQKWIDTNLPRDVKILTCTPHRYYFDREIVAGDSFKLEKVHESTSLAETL